MTEAEQLRAQAARLTQFAQEATDQATVDALLSMAAKSIEQASQLEQLADHERRQQGKYQL